MFDININVNNELEPPMPLTEKLKVISGIFGIRLGEEPEYYLIRSHGEKEIRKYGELTLASITVPVHGDHQRAQAQAYSALSNYIFGKNQSAQQMAMTAAVLHEDKPQQDGAAYLTMTFILPSKFNIENAPAPIDERIKIHQKSAHMVACRVYSGPNDESKVQKYTSELREWLDQYSSYKAASEVQVAEYDGPSTIPFLRKNEVHIDVEGARY